MATAAPASGRLQGVTMTAEGCLMLLVLAVIVASFLFDLHAYLIARRAQHARRRAPDGP